MAAGDINDPLSNVPNIVLVDQSAASAAPGAGYGRVEIVNGVLGLRLGTGAWIGLVSLTAGLLTPLTEKVTPADTDLVLLQDEADASALKKLQVSNLPGGGGGGYTEGCCLRHSTTQSISASTFTAITWDTEEFDVGSMHEGVTNPQRITIPTTGKWLVYGAILWATKNEGYFRIAGVAKNPASLSSADLLAARIRQTAHNFNATENNTLESSVELSFVASLAANDILILVAYQSTSGALNAVGGVTGSYFGAQRIG